ncbi:MAG: hypothetical protein ACHQ7N_11590 [Candidatus Methylomirabilales bacterium]
MGWRRRNLIILIALMGAWGLIFAFRAPWGSSTKSQPRASVGTAPRTPPAQGGGLPRLKKELLALPHSAYPPEAQNFFGTPAPPPPSAQQIAAAAAAAAPPPPPDPFQEEAKRLRFVGFVEDGNKAMAFIIRGSEIFTVAVGSTFLERFRVQALTEDAVLLSSVSGDNQVRLPLAADAAAAPKR